MEKAILYRSEILYSKEAQRHTPRKLKEDNLGSTAPSARQSNCASEKPGDLDPGRVSRDRKARPLGHACTLYILYTCIHM